MKFQVTRVSCWYNQRPCPEAVLSKDGKMWTISFSTLKALMEWVDALGESVVLSNYGDGPQIEIYDDYRE